MQVSLPAGALARAVGLVKGCVPNKATLPVLTHVLIEARAGEGGAGELVVRATNFDMEAEARVAADVAVAGSAAIPGDVLHGIVKRLAKTDTAALALANNRVRLTAGRSSYDLRSLPAEEFPLFKPVEEGRTFEIDAAALRTLIESTIYASSSDDPRVYLNGVYLTPDGDQLWAVTADGHRLALRKMPLPDGAADMPGVIVPTQAAREVASMLGETGGVAKLSVDESKIRLELAGVAFASRLIDGTFPTQFRSLIPARNGAAFTCKPKVLADAVDRALIVFADTDVKAPLAHLVTGASGVDLMAGSASHDRGTEDIEAVVHERGAEVKVNARYLAEMLKVWGDVDLDVQSSQTPGGPVLFSAAAMPEMVHIIMPQQR